MPPVQRVPHSQVPLGSGMACSPEWYNFFTTLFENVGNIHRANNTLYGTNTFKGGAIFDGIAYLGGGRAGIYVHTLYSAKVGGENSGILAYVETSASDTLTVGAVVRNWAKGTNSNCSLFGFVSETLTDPGLSHSIVGSEVSVVNQFANQTLPIIGFDLIFKDRLDTAASPTSGLSTNRYNFDSIGLRIDSQARGSTGEFCGFRRGIVFTANSLDRDISNLAIGIDFTPAAANVARQRAAIALSDSMAISWDITFAIKTLFDSAASLWRVQNSGSDRFTVHVGTGDITAGRDVLSGRNVNVPSGGSYVDQNIGSATATAGTSGAPPAQVAGYWTVSVGGGSVKVPYYNL